MAEELTTRQENLYNLLLSQPDRWFTEKEICDAVEGYEYHDDPKHSTTHCASIFTDKNDINDSNVKDKIIVMKKHCFKIANYDEYRHERMMHIRKLKFQVARVKAMDHKYGIDGTQDIFEEVFHETFINEGENNENRN